ncbi:hypothetical protein [Mesoterricola silvestris]|uniref:Outer membrane protein beta-barrel domain-containing protein n=1 Tax=Mesoterricola silvestris TaxID=2927979 RepID=A0AA48GW83_9BACT|nr:hypothetical protein [Mesoterricola silvestris]BDU72991.1 hypothetical protein METEAL_21650 [Mesoterricola silvestris]
MKRLALSTLFLVSAASLAAADFTGGIQLGPAFPLGDMRDLANRSVGAQLVFFGRWDLGAGSMVRARLEGTSAKGTPKYLNSPFGTLTNADGVQITAATTGLGADYLWYLEGSPARGAYFGTGLSYASNRVDLSLPVASGGTNNTSYNSGGLGYGFYAGYQFSPRWSMELVYRASTFNKDIDVKGQTGTFRYTMPSLSVVAGYTF